MSSELRRVDGISGDELMKAVATFVVGVVGRAGVAALIGLSLNTVGAREKFVGPRISASLENPALATGATWAQILGPYKTPDVSRSVLELAVTAAPFVMLWVLMWAALGVGYWLCLLLAIPTACFLMRLFMIQHDCGHGACFKRRSTNDWVGRTIGVVTLTPYGFWLRAHALHHASMRRSRLFVDWSTAFTEALSSCSGSFQPIFSFCIIGFRSGKCATDDSLG
jgi:hypothetical protein